MSAKLTITQIELADLIEARVANLADECMCPSCMRLVKSELLMKMARIVELVRLMDDHEEPAERRHLQ